ncbi:MAG: low molecular weight protein arginine phosphatase [Promethearchaeota archaeon]
MCLKFPYKNILVVCSVNTARSRMAEGFLKDIFSKINLRVKISSGGISSNAREGMLISMDAKLAMEEVGISLPENVLSIDLKKHPQLIKQADLILTLTSKHKKEILAFFDIDSKEIFTIKEFGGESGDIEDPSMKGIEGFRKTRDEIKESIMKGLKKYM